MTTPKDEPAHDAALNERQMDALAEAIAEGIICLAGREPTPGPEAQTHEQPPTP